MLLEIRYAAMPKYTIPTRQSVMVSRVLILILFIEPHVVEAEEDITRVSEIQRLNKRRNGRNSTGFYN